MSKEGYIQKDVQHLNLKAPMREVKNIDPTIEEINYDISVGQIVIIGKLNRELSYIGTDNILYYQEDSIPFKTYIDVPRAEPGMKARIYPHVEQVKFKLSSNGLELNQKIVLQFIIKIIKENYLNIRSIEKERKDSSSTNKLVKVAEVISENNEQIIIEQTEIGLMPPITIERVLIKAFVVEDKDLQQIIVITDLEWQEVETKSLDVFAWEVVDETLVNRNLEIKIRLVPKAQRIVNVTSNLKNIKLYSEANLNQLLISGMLITRVDYLDLDNNHYNLAKEISFEFILNVEELDLEMNIQIHAQNIDTNFELNDKGDEIVQIVEMEVVVVITEKLKMTVLTDIEGEEINEVIKKTVLLDLVDDKSSKLVPIEVVTGLR
ncbi:MULTISPECIES: DUF3794 domain-containing protein [unclassified Candidatus Frackibacter]|uniref:DUF3794 domain-containing protein n=1 Tax=unclassified Candidatus Frackibacter TaxID=2648818 RepID=UPI000891F729|nr:MULTISPECIES: DUF3794 domain-containing protein [unclassified Candidatus Frackibacter]SDC65787.1 protein of unknown function [Candidatus Frackibacter sp. WG11]SEM78936.1 protein of unknown function [Candidatus Frackibacter sp. WG12]SFL89696.1 protein of unknown function [Candidatus Frackibacter sp. WG13]